MRDENLHFHQGIDSLEQSVLAMVGRAEEMVELAVKALTENDMELADKVIEMDEEIDRLYIQTHNDWTHLMARNQPMGSDLRKMSVLLQLNTTFERMGDQCVNIAKIARFTEDLPMVERMREQIREMGDLVRPMIRAAIEAYLRRDIEAAQLLPTMDQPVDRLNANMYRETLEVRENRLMLEWATKVMMASRALERIGDQAVDFGEQTAYLITGERAEFDETGLD